MIIYFASGFSVINVAGLEMQYGLKFGNGGGWNRLISYNDIVNTSNHVERVIEVAKELNQ